MNHRGSKYSPKFNLELNMEEKIQMKRIEARELIMQLLFQMSIHNDYSKEMIEKFVKSYEFENQKDYFDTTLELALQHMTNINKIIEENANNWKLDRISKVELAILRLAVTEIMYIDDIPESVSINEAVELSKKFGGNDSGKFVNGILGKVVKSKDE